MKTLLIAIFLICSFQSFGAILNAEELYQKGREARDSGDFEKALQYFQAAHMQSPKNTDIHLFLGLTYLNLGAVQKAQDIFLEGLDLAPDYVDLSWGLGRTYMAQKKFEKSEELFSEAVKQAPKYIDIHISFARLYMMQSDFNRAVTVIEQALAINPENERLLILLAQNYFYLKDYQKALGVLDHFSRDHKNGEVFVLKAKVLYFKNEKNWKKAKDLLQFAQKKDPSLLSAYTTLADIYIARWKFHEAREVMKTATNHVEEQEQIDQKLFDIEQIRSDTERFEVGVGGYYMSFEDNRTPWQHYYLSGVWKIAPKHTLITQVLSYKRADLVDTGVKVKYINQLEKWVYLFAGAGFNPNARVVENGSAHIGADLIAHIFPIGGTVFSPSYEVRFFDQQNIYFLNFKVDQYIFDKAVLTAKMYNIFGNSQYYNVWNFRALFHITPQWDIFAAFGTSTEDVNGVLMQGSTYSAGARWFFNEKWYLQGAYTRHQNDLFNANQYSLSIGMKLGSPRK